MHLIKSKCCLFASLWCINNLSCVDKFVGSDHFCLEISVDNAQHIGWSLQVPKILKVVLSYWSTGKLLWACVWSCHPEPCHLGDSPRQKCNDDMPIFLLRSCLGTSNTFLDDKLRCMVFNLNYPGISIIMATFIIADKNLGCYCL